MSNEYIQDYSEQERLIRSNINLAKEEGFEVGIAQGHQEGFEAGMEVGLEEGERNKQLEIAKMLLSNTNTSLKEISLCTGLILEEVTKLKEEIELKERLKNE